MRRVLTLAIIFMLATLHLSCSGSKPYHKDQLPSPSAYSAHFPEMDTNGDALVNWTEFKRHFPNGDAKAFKALDLNQDSTVDTTEWNTYKKVHER